MQFRPTTSTVTDPRLRRSSAALAAVILLGTSGAVSAVAPPAWVTLLKAGQWSAVTSENKATDIDPKSDPAANPSYPGTPRYEGNSGYRSVWEAWTSGALAPDLGACGSILHFGGANDYFGNAVVALNLCGGTSGAPMWQRLSNPYGGDIVLPRASGAFPNGTPVPPHTFDLLAYDPIGKSLVLLESYRATTAPLTVPNAWLFDVVHRQWRGPYAHRGANSGISAYDSKRKLVWFQPQQGKTGELTAFNTATGAFTYYGRTTVSGVGGLDSLMGYDPSRDRLVQTSFRNGLRTLAEHRLDNAKTPWIVARQENAPTTLSGQHAMAWSSRRNAWIVWMADGGPNVYELRYVSSASDGTPTYRWTNLTTSANTVRPLKGGVKTNGAFEKFQLVAFNDATEVLVGQLRLADGVFAFRLPASAASPTPPVVTPPVVTPPVVTPPVVTPPVVIPPVVTPPPSGPAAPFATQAAAIAPGHWAAIAADNQASDVNPELDPAANPSYPNSPPYRGNSGFRSIWQAWNSGVYAPTLGSCGGLLYFGGGHNDYAGNEVVGLDLCGGVTGGPVWQRLSNPYPGPIQWPYAKGAYPNATPAPPHTYDLLAFDQASNSLVLLNSSVSGPLATYSTHAWLFSLSTRRWTGPFEHRGAMEGTSAYDSQRRIVWFQPEQGRPGELTAFNTAAGTFNYYGWPSVNGVGNLDSLMGYDPQRDKLVLASFRSDPPVLAEHDLANPTTPWQRVVQRSAPANIVGQHAFAWSKLRGAWIVWMSHRGSTVYEVRYTGLAATGEPEYTWRPLTASTNTVLPIGSDVDHLGSFEKFQIVSTADNVELLVGQLRVQDGIKAFRIPPPGSEPPIVALPPGSCGDPIACKMAEPGWANVCSQPGVFICDNFGSEASLDGTVIGGDTTPRLDAAQGHLVFSIPSGSGANAGGQYAVAFPPFGEGKFIALSYRIKADAAALALEGRKEFTMWRGSSPCTDLELTQTHYYASPIFVPYTECGAGHFSLPLPANDLLMHYPDYHCNYRGISTSYDGCAITHADVWENFYIEVNIGTYGQPNSRVVMWHKSDGGTWKRYIETNEFTFRGNGGFENLMLTVYMTGKDRTIVHAPGEVRYDHLIMSSKPFNVDALLGP